VQSQPVAPVNAWARPPSIVPASASAMLSSNASPQPEAMMTTADVAAHEAPASQPARVVTRSRSSDISYAAILNPSAVTSPAVEVASDEVKDLPSKVAAPRNPWIKRSNSISSVTSVQTTESTATCKLLILFIALTFW